MNTGPFHNLSQPIHIRGLRLANRLSVAPIVHNLATESGAVTERLIDAYQKKGRGGWGLVMVEASHVSQDYTQFNRMLGICDNKQVGGLAELAESIQEGGAKAGIQIMHPGGLAPYRWNLKQPLSPTKMKMVGVETRALSIPEIEKISDEFAEAAFRAKLAGFDLVNLHGAHGFLIHQFLSPLFNQRDDEYGVPEKFVLEVIRKTREAVGSRFPVTIRISGEEHMGEGGADLQHMSRIAPLLVEAGIDCLDVSAGSSAGSPEWIAQPVYFPHGCLVHLAENIKKTVDVPVVTAGRINQPKLAEEIVAGGRADIVSIGRGALADPDFARKALKGKSRDIRRCTSCYLACARVGLTGTRCSLNFELGRYKHEYEILVATQPKKVMVIGGGVAGMEAARIAALRGHQVQLYEKSNQLGGVAAKVASAIARVDTRDIRLYGKWLQSEIEQLPLEICLQTDVEADLVNQKKPDAIILATGSQRILPDIPGVDNPRVMTLEEYLKSRKPSGKKAVVIGGEDGSEVALSLARYGNSVTIIEEGRSIARAPYLTTRRFVLLRYIKEAGITILTQTRVEEIDANSVMVVDPENHKTGIPADIIVMATSRQPNDGLATPLENLGIEIYKVGDCDKTLHTLHAIHSASRIGRQV